MQTFYATITILAFICSAGFIDGPTGYESNNWIGCFTAFAIGLLFGYLTIRQQAKENNEY
tara:strand:+ start:47 stop:226 length:180 start_codon:yes stop_codon:yes gene_type:complete